MLPDLLYITDSQCTYMEDMATSMVGREADVKTLMSYLHGDTDKLCMGPREKPYSSKYV